MDIVDIGFSRANSVLLAHICRPRYAKDVKGQLLGVVTHATPKTELLIGDCVMQVTLYAVEVPHTENFLGLLWFHKHWPLDWDTGTIWIPVDAMEAMGCVFLSQ